MSDRSLSRPDGVELELMQLGRSLAFPAPSAVFADRVSDAIRTHANAGAPSPALRAWRPRTVVVFGRPVRRALLLAAVLVLAAAAVAAAIGLGLPGLRITFGRPGASPIVIPSRAPSPAASSSSVPGGAMGLGLPVPLDELDARAGFHVLLPQDPRFGRPDAAYLLAGRLALVWGPRSGVPETLEPGVALVISEFRAAMDDGYFEKVTSTGTSVTDVTVAGGRGYWIDGDPHFFFWIDPSGHPVEDTHRVVGDTLVWTQDAMTYRVESSLGKEATIALAESMR